MNLNELREVFIREYPSRCIHITACCKYNPESDFWPGRRTEFMASLWRIGRNNGIECQVYANTPDDLISAVRAKLAEPADEQAEVELEPVNVQVKDNGTRMS